MYLHNHEGARHCRKPLGRRKGLNISTTVGFTKFPASIQIFSTYSSTVGMTKRRAFVDRSYQNVCSTVEMTKSRAFPSLSW